MTCYVALPFGAGDDGPEPRELVECTSANAVIRSAVRMARTEKNVGAVAFSRTGDPASGESANAVLLKAFGEAPVIERALSSAVFCSGMFEQVIDAVKDDVLRIANEHHFLQPSSFSR